LPSHEVDDDDLSALRFTAYSPDPTVFEGYRQYPPGGYVAGGVDGTVEIADVPDGPYTLQVAYADHSDWYGYDDQSPTWFNVTAGRRGQVTAPPGTMIDLTGVTLGEAWTIDAIAAAACANTNSALDDIFSSSRIGTTQVGSFDWGAVRSTALIDGSAGDVLVVLHRTEAVFPTDIGAFPGTTATEMFAPPPFTQTPGATTAFTGSFTPLVATTSAVITPEFVGETNFWMVDVSAGPGTADGVPGAVLAEFTGAADPEAPIPIVVADPFDPSWPLLARASTLLSGLPGSPVIVAIGDADVSTAKPSSTLLIDDQSLGPQVMWGGAKTITFGVDSDLPGFELDFSSGSATIHVYAGSASVMLPREALLQNVLYTPTTIIGSGAVTTHQQWVNFELSPF
jgi:hypothetical protein